MAAIAAHPYGVVVAEDERDQIVRPGVRWNRRIQRGDDVLHVLHDVLVEARVPLTLQKFLERDRIVLRDNRAGRPDGAGKQLCGVASSCEHIEDGHAGLHAHECEHLGGMATSIRLTIRRGAVRTIDYGLDLGGNHDIGGQRDPAAIGPQAPDSKRRECNSAHCARQLPSIGPYRVVISTHHRLLSFHCS
jgi:hypothetical protein